MTKILACGLGGGLDVLNASLIYFATKQNGMAAALGSVRPGSLDELNNHSPFASSGSWINSCTTSNYKGGDPRFAEPRIASLLGEDVLYLARKYHNNSSVPHLREAILVAKEKYSFNHLFFVDGGGDSLILRSGDSNDTTQDSDPFWGGDATTLEALSGIPNCYLAVISVGLDIDEKKFRNNVSFLAEMGAYYGKLNIRTGECVDYSLSKILSFKDDISDYFALAKSVLVLEDSDLSCPEKTMSHTAVVTYHALKGDYGLHRTYVSWEPKDPATSKPGVIVRPEHCWMYFFDASRIHQLKKDINRQAQ